ncbi:MAG: hypothetical protein WC732_09845, partial [Candidatus Omnitrophota bacterium]
MSDAIPPPTPAPTQAPTIIIHPPAAAAAAPPAPQSPHSDFTPDTDEASEDDVDDPTHAEHPDEVVFEQSADGKTAVVRPAERRSARRSVPAKPFNVGRTKPRTATKKAARGAV